MKMIDFVVCDDIRREEGHKKTLVGCYNDRIQVSFRGEKKWPIVKTLAFYARFQFEEKDLIPDSFSIEFFIMDKKIGETGGEFVAEVDKSRPLVIDLVYGGFQIVGEGDLGVVYHFKKDSQPLQSLEPSCKLLVSGVLNV